MTVVVPGIIGPLLAAFAYRRTGLGWGRAWSLAALGALLALVGGIIGFVVFGYAIAVDAGLCGPTPALAVAAGIAAYLAIASWAALSPRRVWAWTFTVAAGIAASVLVSYFFAGAHAYCET